MIHDLNVLLRLSGAGKRAAPSLLCALMLMAWVGVANAAPRWVLPQNFPSQVNHGLELMREPNLREAVAAFEQAKPGTRIRILHAKADEGSQLASQLHDWLLVTGFNPAQLEFKASKKFTDQLAVELVKP